MRGSAPGTRETDLLDPVNTVDKIHAILLSGGSAFGLDAAAGVMQFLEERGIGYETGAARIPIVPAAVIFDLNVGDASVRPDRQAGYAACRQAHTRECQEGSVGAGTGATVGKVFGIEHAMKGGVGTASIQSGPWVVGALVVVNCFGDVVDPCSGRILAGSRIVDGKGLRNSVAWMKQREQFDGPLGENTTLGVVATDARLTKAETSKLAQMAQDGLARAINPVHTPFDGDTVFALSTGEQPVDPESRASVLTILGTLAAEVVSQAICRAVMSAVGLPGIPGYAEWVGSQVDGS